MSLFTYIIDLPQKSAQTGSITAKTEHEAREQISQKYPEGQHLLLEAQAALNSAPVQKAVKKATKKAAKKAAKKVVAKGLSKLERYLYLQHGRCFFCGEKLRLEDASVEHLNPVSKGGTRTEDNEVACCATVNHTFGDMDLKRKFEFVLKSSSDFKCPRVKGKASTAVVPEKLLLAATPENHGLAWSEKEEKQLLSRYQQDMEIEAIAQRHKRGVGAIRARLVKLGQIEEMNQT
ncbi:HNH endonuclease [Coraliomargarita sp. SDUM461003]|uniref:HNH endonuclease n=1 Tax=Thalassobacterium maritimum TaxID=3041265 RepID=A0ABU1AZ70_9BACT|nr:HNH endonuclease [Coraliomargarita sp. SDUM461003]MDQ8209418.1 HNH endonuclease [Coraliomargarita sp. SDUM461003]